MKVQIYRITVQGILNAEWTAYFDGNSLAGQGDLTRITAEVPDSAALYGLLNRIRDLNLRLISVQLMEQDGGTPVECHRCPYYKPPKQGINPEIHL